MPKALSLKKGGVKPSQKSITQFFKNNETKAQKVVPDAQRPAPDNVKSSNSLKRKATSPVSKNLVLNLEHLKVPRSPQKSPKKIKKSNEIYPQIAMVTLQKENGSNQSALKIINHEHCINVDSENHVKDLEKRESRSPLSQVSSNGINCDINKLLESENVKIENHDEIMKTPQKTQKNSSPRKPKQSCSPLKVSMTPQKISPVQTELRRSPRIAKKTPEKSIIVSPIKERSTAKVALDFENVDDMFGDEWDNVDIPDSEDLVDNLDLSLMKRCEVVSVQHQATCTELRLRSDDGQTGSCYIKGLWRETPLYPGEIVSVSCARDAAGRHVIDACSGLLVLRPDHLMSTTSVVAGVFCRRKAVLQERFKGIDAANHAMTIGILIHELVQATLTHPASAPSAATLGARTDALVARSTRSLHAAALAAAEARASVETYLRPLEEFMRMYVGPGKSNGGKDKWAGHIDDILDIEENVCCPQLGLKGKIDATLKVTIHERKGRKTAIVPLELKSGRASGSPEHRGQLVLYNMMLSAQRDCAPTEPDQRGLLLYLKERVDLREVSCGYPEKRDLIMLRNQLVQYLSTGPDAVDSEKLTDIEEAAHLLRQTLPDPVHHQNACSKCPYLTICSLHLWHTEGPTVSPDHPLEKLREQALGHLSSDHVTYFLHWTALLRMEERVQMTSSPLHALWTEDPVKRRKRGACTADLKLKSVVASDDRFVHVFEKADQNEVAVTDGKTTKGPQEGEFSIVSVKKRPWIAAGVISLLRGKELHIMLERDLSRRQSKDTVYHIDTYESYATTVQNLTNLGVLMEDSDRALRLRRLIIDKEPAEFELKLPREVGRFGAKLMKTLNIQQQRAVLRTLAARDYALLQGLPGTGKTQTISVLIQMLVALKQRVLVTAHTHSAVDTVLTRLPSSLRVMRLGSSARVAASLQSRCEQPLTEACTTPEALQEVYDSMEVVGVTCLGANHAVLARTTFDVCIVDEATQEVDDFYKDVTIKRSRLTTDKKDRENAERSITKEIKEVDDFYKDVTIKRSRLTTDKKDRENAERSITKEIKVPQCTVLRALLSAARFVLVGDPEQLPPVVRSRSARRLGMEASLFHRLNNANATSTLQLQYRMNAPLTTLANSVAYSGRLTCANAGVAEATHAVDTGKLASLYTNQPWLLQACSPDLQLAAVFIDLGETSEPDGHKLCDREEAWVVLALVQAFRQCGVNPSDIGVIAPYREQVALLRRAVARLRPPAAEVSTVDQFQGRDKSVILYSCTRSDQHAEVKEGEVLSDQRRLAVSVTRAKHKLIFVGHSRALNRYAPLQAALDACTTLRLEADVKEEIKGKYAGLVA